MKNYSIFNDVLGPVMHGPSSSHTAASFRLGCLARDLLGVEPVVATFTFDPEGSYGRVYREQGSDLAFVSGLLGWSITDPRFFDALNTAASQGMDVSFLVDKIEGDDHPNAVSIALKGHSGDSLQLLGRSTGGGGVEITAIDGWAVALTGEYWETLIWLEAAHLERVKPLLPQSGTLSAEPEISGKDGRILIHCQYQEPPDDELLKVLDRDFHVNIRRSSPVFFVQKGQPLFNDGAEMLRYAQMEGISLGKAAIRYEATLLGLSEKEIIGEMSFRLDIMSGAVENGLNLTGTRPMQLLKPSAHNVYAAERQGRVAAGGPLTRASARALAAMEINSSMGLVCAAPTGGSSGVIPGVALTLEEDFGYERETVIEALFAASGIGLVFLMRGKTFAAEVAGCQVEIGAAGAMAAAAVVDAAGGSSAAAADAAAVSLQNTMGSVCDLVQGIVEIPCHTRNAVAASSAFICADLVMGGYENPISLDDSVDASLEVGRALGPKYRCTALGGIAITPSALKMKKLT